MIFGLRQSEWFSGKEKIKKKITMVRAHPLHVPISEKNPTGITIRDRHIRRLPGTYLKREEILGVFKNYRRQDIVYPTPGKIPRPKNADNYDELIAVWVDYFNNKLKTDLPLDPDVFKALLASESGFRIVIFDRRIYKIQISPFQWVFVGSCTKPKEQRPS